MHVVRSGGRLPEDRASIAIAQLTKSTVQCLPTVGLVREVWSLRDNLSAYDACYVALARALDCPLLTVDGPLTRAPRLDVTLISIPGNTARRHSQPTGD